MRLLFILENYYPNIGGVETLFKSLCENLVKKGFTVTVLTNRFSDDLLKEEVINGVQIIRLPFKNRYLFTFFSVFHCLKYARRHDLIHTTSYNACFPAFFAGLFTRKRVIITFHEVWGKLWFKLPFFGKSTLLLHYLYEYFILKLPFYKFIAVSNYTVDSLKAAGISEKKIVKIYNGINYDEFVTSAPKTLVKNEVYTFCFFARLGLSKGIDLLIGAVALLAQKNLNFRINLILPKEPADVLIWIKDLINQNKVGSYISMQHHLNFEELKQNITGADAVVISSLSEGFCFAAVENYRLRYEINKFWSRCFS